MTAILNPATEETIAEIAPASAEETDAAVARAKKAFPAWRAVAPGDRARLLRRLATLVEEHGEELARLESRNVGKPISGARGDGVSSRLRLTWRAFDFCAPSCTIDLPLNTPRPLWAAMPR